jgi:hypothetical protein
MSIWKVGSDLLNCSTDANDLARARFFDAVDASGLFSGAERLLCRTDFHGFYGFTIDDERYIMISDQEIRNTILRDLMLMLLEASPSSRVFLRHYVEDRGQWLTNEEINAAFDALLQPSNINALAERMLQFAPLSHYLLIGTSYMRGRDTNIGHDVIIGNYHVYYVKIPGDVVIDE